MNIRAALAAVTEPNDATMTEIHRRLERAAAQQELLDLTYRTVDSPFGALLIAATPQGLVRLAFERDGHDAVLERMAVDISPRILRSTRRLDDVARQLDEYFGRNRRHFELPLDLQLVHGFRRVVLDRLRQVDYGTTTTYKTIAAAVGNPKAVRAVGSACANNPIPVIVPCHRVLRSDGRVGQYLGSAETKSALLALEAT